MIELRWLIKSITHHAKEDDDITHCVETKVLQYRLLKVTTINECLQTESDWIDVPEVWENTANARLAEIEKLQAQNAKYRTALQDIKKHLEVVVYGTRNLSTVWNIADRALME